MCGALSGNHIISRDLAELISLGSQSTSAPLNMAQQEKQIRIYQPSHQRKYSTLAGNNPVEESTPNDSFGLICEKKTGGFVVIVLR